MKASPVLNKAGTQKATTKTNEPKKMEKVETNQKQKITVLMDKAGNPIKVEKVGVIADKAGNSIKAEKIESGQKFAKKMENNKLSKAGSNEKKLIYKNEDGDQIWFQQCDTVPEPQQTGQTSIRHYSYFHNKKKNTFYFYPISSIDGDCRYIQHKEQPKMDQQFLNTLNRGYPKEPIYIVPASTAIKTLEEFKKQDKYQRIVNFDSQQWKNFNKGW